MAKFYLSAFADEAGGGIKEQINALKAHGMTHLEPRGLDEGNISLYTEEQAKELKKILDENDIKISAIGSHYGKIKITEDFEEHFENFKNCVKFDVSGIKVLGFNGIDILSFNKNETIEKDDVAVIYFHGGGYVRPPRNHHISFIKKFANKSRLPIYFATYPTAPKNTCKDVLPLVENFYKNVCKYYNKTILMGDSSGGGLALCLSKILLEKKEVLPTKTILFAPWVDVSLTNPELEDYQKVDPFIDFKHEQIWGKLWAGDLDVKDEKVSPMFADFKGLNDVVLYVGTREVLYPDIVKFYNKLKSDGVNVELIEGVGMNHVYPIYPIPEARSVMENILTIIKE